MAAFHRRRHVPLEQLFLTRLDDGEPDSPNPATEQIHAEQPRNQEVDVARPRRNDTIVPNRRDVLAAARALHDFVHLQAREPAFRARRIVAIH